MRNQPTEITLDLPEISPTCVITEGDTVLICINDTAVRATVSDVWYDDRKCDMVVNLHYTSKWGWTDGVQFTYQQACLAQDFNKPLILAREYATIAGYPLYQQVIF